MPLFFLLGKARKVPGWEPRRAGQPVASFFWVNASRVIPLETIGNVKNPSIFILSEKTEKKRTNRKNKKGDKNRKKDKRKNSKEKRKKKEPHLKKAKKKKTQRKNKNREKTTKEKGEKTNRKTK